MNDWGKATIQKLDEQVANLPEKDLRFYRIDEYKRNIQRVADFASGCRDCAQHKKQIESTLSQLHEAIHTPGKARQQYDRHISSLSRHMQKVHGFYPPYYFTYLFSFYGTAAGIGLGYLFTLINETHRFELFTLGFLLLFMPLYLIGSRKDSKIRRNQRLM